MSALNEYFCETHMIGDGCKQNELDQVFFPVLGEAGFIWVGYSVLKQPYRIVRLSSVHSHVVACVEGEGRALIDGELVPFRRNQLMTGPVGRHHAFEASSDDPWVIGWVFYRDSVQDPVLSNQNAQLSTANIKAFINVLKMLIEEAAGLAQPATMSSLVNLLDIHTRRMIGLSVVDDRLTKLWVNVEANLSHAWSVRELAQIACMSEEHLRRLCHQYYQRSPIEHLTKLRLRRAGTLLRTTSHTVEVIAQSVGYASMYSFSVAFKRWGGLSPSIFRKQSAVHPIRSS